jgi:hypothetical protein
MNDKSFYFWQQWLVYANIMALLVGLLCAFAGNSFFFSLHNYYTEEVFFEGQPMTGNLLYFKNWLFGIIGGTIVGFHLLMLFIIKNAYRKKEKWAYQALWTGLLSWFFIDSGISLYYGAIHNIIIINLAALTLIAIPLIATRQEF